MDIYGIIGYPLKHSFSNKFFTEKFVSENINALHKNFEIDRIERLLDIIKNEPNLKGLNVTIPYKEKVIPYLDELDDTAQKIGAVNVVRVDRKNGKPYLKGFNTDLVGFQNSIAPCINPTIHKKALILGTGGASKAVKYGLINLGIEVVFVSRTKADGIFTYDDLNETIMNEYKVIVNTTPLGTFPKNEGHPDIPYNLLTKDHLLYDLVYNPPVTKFLELGANQRAETKNGAEMFELQAIATWNIWNNNIL